MVYCPWSWIAAETETVSSVPHFCALCCSHGDGNSNTRHHRPKHHSDHDHGREAKGDLVLEPWSQVAMGTCISKWTITRPYPTYPTHEHHMRMEKDRKKIEVQEIPVPRREAAASAIGGSIHAIIEQPITTPIEASITQTQVNGMLGGSSNSVAGGVASWG